MRLIAGVLILAGLAYAQYFPPGGAITTATFASSPSPTLNKIFLFTDASATGACTGGGTSFAVCVGDGNTFVAIAGTSTGLGDPGANSIVYRNASGTSTPATATQMSGPSACSDAGASDTYACNLSPAITSYITGTLYWFKANTANTGAASINFNARGVLVIKKRSNGTTTDLSDNDIGAGQWVGGFYDGTDFQMATYPGWQPNPVFNTVVAQPATAVGALIGRVTNGGSEYGVEVQRKDTNGHIAGINGLGFFDGTYSAANANTGTLPAARYITGTPSDNDCMKFVAATGTLTSAGAACGSGSMVYPGAGVPNSTGSAWGTSYTVGTAANNLVQLNASSQLPAVSAALLTNFPTLNQNTTGTAAGLSATLVAGSGGTGIANTATLTLGSSNVNLATLGTGLVKNTTTTGALTNAAAADVYGLWSGTCNSSTFLRGDGSCQAPGGSGTVTSSGTPLINQLAVFTTSTDIKGIAVGTTGKPLVGATGADPIWSNLTLTNPATSAVLTIANTASLITVGAFALTLTATATTNATYPAGTTTLAANTGTPQTTWQIDSGNSGPKLKNASGVLEVRNAADDAYAAIKASEFQAPAGTAFLASGATQTAPTVTVPTFYFNTTADLGQYLNASSVLTGTMVLPAASRTANQFATHVSTTGAVTTAAIVDADVPDTITASNYQPLDTDLTTIGGLAKTDDNIMVANGTAWELKALPDCSNGTTSKLLYNISTNAFSCGTDQSAGGMTDPMTTRGDMIYRDATNTTARLAVGTGVLKANGTDVTGFAALADADIPDTITASNYQPLDTDLTTIGGLAKTDDNIIVANGSIWELKALPDCSNGTTSKLLYNITTNAFSCGTDQTASVVGSDTQLIFNDGGSAYGGDAGLTYNKTTDTLTVAGAVNIGSGTTPLNMTGYTDDAAPSAPGTANQFAFFVDRTSGLPSWILNAGTQKYVAYGDSAGIPVGDDTAYAAGWNASTKAPTQNAVYDQMELKAPLISPSFTTPTLGVATVTSINKVAITAPATSATLTIADGSSLVTSGAYAITFTATGTTGVTLPTSGTLATTTDVTNYTAPTEAYDATNWDADTAPPQKDAVRDKIETLAPKADAVLTGSVQIPNGASPTVDAAGEMAVDTTSDQLQVGGTGDAKRALPTIQFVSFAIPAPADTDDINLMKAPFGMTIIGIDAIVQGTTSATGQLQECDSAGANCTDLDSDIVADADGAADDGSLTDSAIASGAWIRWKTTSVSGTPTFLTVTIRYRVVPD